MIIPWGTDAPIYHWPKGTVALIVINIAAFVVASGLTDDEQMSWTLLRGDGLHPVQWLTSNFMHANFEHLIGNMIFLWGFGIVVEGKLGWLRFLPVYLGLCLAFGAVMQIGSLRAPEGHILGASAAIYGLLAMCLVWAPRNDLQCVAFFRLTPSMFDLPILTFALLYIGLEAAAVFLTGGAMSSALLHLTGAILGFLLGTIMLKANWVDCENWDLYAVMQGRQGKSKRQAMKERRKAPKPAPAPSPRKKRVERTAEDRSATALERMRGHIEQREVHAALGVYDKAVRTLAGWQPPATDWLELIKALVDERAWAESVTVMEDYLRRAPDPSPRVRITLAQVLIHQQQRPAHALRVLADVPEQALPESLQKLRRQLIRRAEQMREEGVLELDGEAW